MIPLLLLPSLPFGISVFCDGRTLSAHIVCGILGLLILSVKSFAQLLVGRSENSGHSLKQWKFFRPQFQSTSFVVVPVSRKRKGIIVTLRNVIAVVVGVVAWVRAMSFFSDNA